MDIMFINQQALFTTIGKYIGLRLLVPISDITNEESYRDLYVVMRHYKKSVFCAKLIECESKFKSIMDEVSNEMGIEMNDENPYNNGTEKESNNRVTK